MTGVQRLEPGEVHVWSVRLQQAPEEMERCQGVLAAEERERAQRLAHEALPRFVLGRGVLRRLLAAYLGQPPEALRFRYGPLGKPELEGAADVHFNVSHSGSLLLVALARGARVGVDVEAVRDVGNAERVAQRVFPPTELERWRALPGPERRAGFARHWTRVEAMAKLFGTGVWGLSGMDPAALAALHVHPLEVPPGYLATLAAEGDAPPRVRQRAWPEAV